MAGGHDGPPQHLRASFYGTAFAVPVSCMKACHGLDKALIVRTVVKDRIGVDHPTSRDGSRARPRSNLHQICGGVAAGSRTGRSGYTAQGVRHVSGFDSRRLHQLRVWKSQHAEWKLWGFCVGHTWPCPMLTASHPGRHGLRAAIPRHGEGGTNVDLHPVRVHICGG